jgi:hypothetical protein
MMAKQQSNIIHEYHLNQHEPQKPQLAIYDLHAYLKKIGRIRPSRIYTVTIRSSGLHRERENIMLISVHTMFLVMQFSL